MGVKKEESHKHTSTYICDFCGKKETITTSTKEEGKYSWQSIGYDVEHGMDVREKHSFCLAPIKTKDKFGNKTTSSVVLQVSFWGWTCACQSCMKKSISQISRRQWKKIKRIGESERAGYELDPRPPERKTPKPINAEDGRFGMMDL